ncbi:hypothetical protein PhCBS80983_g01104 [Powellomyces hirtus]|uniref:Uncharacterized protein n=1 Tax=Powellomyces hirtus TaxID=109895 RepID=A0A507ECN6_9FUNG|nr:hypothetical protein PhCBS80983_g01104 [Powellomyces hirtus]
MGRTKANLAAIVS